MTVQDLLTRASGRELQAWQQFFVVKARREDEQRRHREFLGSEDDEVHQYGGTK
jgi:hypothetical protein